MQNQLPPASPSLSHSLCCSTPINISTCEETLQKTICHHVVMLFYFEGCFHCVILPCASFRCFPACFDYINLIHTFPISLSSLVYLIYFMHAPLLFSQFLIHSSLFQGLFPVRCFVISWGLCLLLDFRSCLDYSGFDPHQPNPVVKLLDIASLI